MNDPRGAPRLQRRAQGSHTERERARTTADQDVVGVVFRQPPAHGTRGVPQRGVSEPDHRDRARLETGPAHPGLGGEQSPHRVGVVGERPASGRAGIDRPQQDEQGDRGVGLGQAFKNLAQRATVLARRPRVTLENRRVRTPWTRGLRVVRAYPGEPQITAADRMDEQRALRLLRNRVSRNRPFQNCVLPLRPKRDRPRRR